MPFLLWLKFLICTVLIFFAGSKLSSYADYISRRSRFSSGLMGILFLAAITSCPELFTSIGAVSVVSAPDLALGDLLGAVAINVTVIALLSLFAGRGNLFVGATKGNRLSAVLTGVMVTLILLSTWMHNTLPGELPRIGSMGLGSLFIGLTYLSGMWYIYRHETSRAIRVLEEPIRKIYLAKFAISAIIIIGSGLWLAAIGEQISSYYGLGQLYVGALCIALATTLPEFIVSFTALRQGNRDMAAGNLLGSNFFNLCIIPLVDIAVLGDSAFLARVSSHAIALAFFVLIINGLAITALTVSTPKPAGIVRTIPWLIIAVFICGHIILSVTLGGM